MSDEKRVDVLAVMDAHAGGIEEAIKSARGAFRSDIIAGLAEFREARAAVAELIEAADKIELTHEGGLVLIRGIARLHNALANLGAKP